MIFNDWEKLKEFNKNIFDLLGRFDASKYSDGRYRLEDGVYLNIDTYMTGSREDRRFEAHRKFIDVQYMILGEELIEVVAPALLEPESDYNCDRDIIFFRNNTKGIAYHLNVDSFLLLTPEDAHMPCISIKDQMEVRKAVFKIPVS